MGPIQVRYADGERERLVEYKLFVGSLNKHATEKEVEEIFLPYGRVEDVYLMRDEMKQSRGCGFVKYSSREVAMAAINALNGIYTMRGCEQPLIVRFADPKRPRPGEARATPPFGGPGFGPRMQSPGIRPPNFGEGAMHGNIPQNAWHPMSQQGMGPPDINMHGYNNQMPPRSGDAKVLPLSSNPQNMSPLKKPNQSPQPFSQPPPSNPIRPSTGQPTGQGQQPPNSSATQSQTFSQGFPSMHGGFIPPPVMNQYQVPGQQMGAPPVHQSASPLAQMLSQQKQNLQASYQSSQQTFSQLQQQMQLMQPANPNPTPQQGGGRASYGAPGGKPVVTEMPGAKCNWTEHTSPDGYKYYYNSTTGESKWEKPEELAVFEQQQKPQEQQQQKPPPPQQQQQQQNVPHQQAQSQGVPHQQTQSYSHNQGVPHQQTQAPQMQVPNHLAQGRHPQQLQHPNQPSPYPNAGVPGHQNMQPGFGYGQMPVGGGSMNDSARFQQGAMQGGQDWMWKNKTAGS